jgi:UDP-N-acetylglucosamine--N-acetylmuramyl-(pentapeptide) pyrophosphoryl-undecaprenol N-acetylglucosamine transferase
MKIAIMAGGTGGHIFPGIAVAKELIRLDVSVIWLGAIGGMEQQIVQRNNINIQLLDIKALRGKGIKGLITLPFKLIKATYKAAKIFKKEEVNAVLSMGGYVAGPGGLAAKLKRIPLVVHEQNSKFGMTNRYLSKWAQKVLTGFNLNGVYNSEFVGNPVRREIENCEKQINTTDKTNILILGGSLGAQSLNTIIPKLLTPLLNQQQIKIKHQCGKNKLNATLENYPKSDDLEVKEFINEMELAYSWADFVIARAGALTVAEINSVGLPAIFVPYPYAVDDHQTSNAKNIKNNKAAFIWQESESEDLLKESIQQLVTNPLLRADMSIQSKSLHADNAALKVAKICMEVAK